MGEIEDARTVNTNKHNNYEIVQVVDAIDSDSDIGSDSKCCMEDSAFLVDNEDISNMYEEKYKRNFMSNYWKF